MRMIEKRRQQRIEAQERAARVARALFIASLAVVLLFFAAFGGTVLAYAAIAADLPSPDELRGRAATFASTKIYARDGTPLYEIFDPEGGRRTVVPLERIAPYMRQAIVATEDKHFYRHPGVDPIGILRAVWQNVRERDIVSGASTITQQLARGVLLSPEERTQRTLKRKIKEAVLATELTRRYSKDTILEIYLNTIYYGNLAYGVEAASEIYFDKSASELTLAEAAFLAGLPQAPAVYDPFTNPEAALQRQATVLGLMVEEGYITPEQAAQAQAEAQSWEFSPPRYEIAAPHFVNYVRGLLEQKYGREVLYRGGLRVYTTLDPKLQALAEQSAREQVAALKDRHVTNAALVAMRPASGEIVAMLGSVDFFDADIDGQVNVAVRLRQPGSSIKPVTYLAAFEKGWTPSTLIMDIPTEFPDGANPPYKPQNYDRKFHGPVLVRSALANSYNVPAVKTLQFVGLPAMLDMAHRLGINSLNRPDYGLSLTLGGGDVTLLEMVGAYAVLANNGQRVPPVAILRIEDSTGRVVEQYGAPEPQQVIRPQHAYLITNILADDEARVPAFGPHNALALSRPAAAKTGTTDDWRDAWTIGYTPDLVTGVWVGNSDNTPMDHVPGSRGAAPIWHDFMEAALQDSPVHDFPRPEGIVSIEICADSGTLPSEVCPKKKLEIFAADQPPLGPEHDIHQLIKIDRSTGQRATEYCPANLVEEVYFQVYPEEARQWAEEHGHPQPPRETCQVHVSPAEVTITAPTEGQHVSEVLTIVGTANVPDFSHYVLDFGVGPDPIGWGGISGPHEGPVAAGVLGQWNTRDVPNGLYSVRVVVFDRHGGQAEARVHVVVDNAPPTARPTDTPKPTAPPAATPTATPTATASAIPTDTPTTPATPTAAPSATLGASPTATPTDTPTVAPTDTPTATPTPTVAPTDTPTATVAPTDTPTPPPTATPTATSTPGVEPTAPPAE